MKTESQIKEEKLRIRNTNQKRPTIPAIDLKTTHAETVRRQQINESWKDKK